MDLVIHLFYFVVCCVLIAITWLVYLFFNNLIDKMQRGMFQSFLGTAAVVVLFALVSGIVYQFALSFFVGLILAMLFLFLFYAGKKAVADLSSSQAQ